MRAKKPIHDFEEEQSRLMFLYNKILHRQRLAVNSRFEGKEYINLNDRGLCSCIEIKFMYLFFNRRTGEELFITEPTIKEFQDGPYDESCEEEIPKLSKWNPAEDLFDIVYDSKYGYSIRPNMRRQAALDYQCVCIPTGEAALFFEEEDGSTLTAEYTAMEEAVDILIQNKDVFNDPECRISEPINLWEGINVSRPGLHVEYPATDKQLKVARAALMQKLPEPLRFMYSTFNGCQIDGRKLQILPISKTYMLTPHEMKIRFPSMQQGIVFGKADDGFPVWIDTDDGWTIHHFENGDVSKEKTWESLSDWLMDQLKTVIVKGDSNASS